jgi:hypothetical protein
MSLSVIGVFVTFTYVRAAHDNHIRRIELEIIGTIGGRLLTEAHLFQEVAPKLARNSEFGLDEEYEALNKLMASGHITYVMRPCNDLAGYGHTCRFYYSTL